MGHVERCAVCNLREKSFPVKLVNEVYVCVSCRNKYPQHTTVIGGYPLRQKLQFRALYNDTEIEIIDAYTYREAFERCLRKLDEGNWEDRLTSLTQVE